MKRTTTHLRTIIVIFLSLIVVLEIGFISLRHPLRVDLSKQKLYQLSPRTRSVLDDLDQRLKIIVLLSENAQEGNPQSAIEMADLALDMRNLLEEYETRSRQITVEWVDPYRDMNYTRDLAIKYDFANPDGTATFPVVIFDLGDGERTTSVHLNEIVERKWSEEARRTVVSEFKGEQAFTGAIHKLLYGGDAKVYFLSGSGAGSINDSNQMGGLSALSAFAGRENLDFQELILRSNSIIPEDAAALVIPGPKERLPDYELNLIENYLSQGGRLLVLLDDGIETGLEPILRNWRIETVNVAVADPSVQSGSDFVVKSSDFNLDHPITKALVAEDRDICFYKPMIVYPTDEESSIHAGYLFLPGRGKSTVEINGELLLPCLGATAERNVANALGGQSLTTRLVVIGDSDFISNAGYQIGGNTELFMASIDWLLDRDIVISPKRIEDIRPTLTRKQKVQLFCVNIAVIPAVAVALALLMGYRRRK
ncbi:MAG: GldG family protein [Pontiellaceae bacterium]|nr:GldG family protein [Pontiellaceae bacterium]